jgi:hypothetical protein
MSQGLNFISNAMARRSQADQRRPASSFLSFRTTSGPLLDRADLRSDSIHITAARRHRHLSLATQNQQSVPLDLDGQVISDTDPPFGQGAVRTQHLAFDGQIVGLTGTDEAEAGKTGLRLLGHEARLVIAA